MTTAERTRRSRARKKMSPAELAQQEVARIERERWKAHARAERIARRAYAEAYAQALQATA